MRVACLGVPEDRVVPSGRAFHRVIALPRDMESPVVHEPLLALDPATPLLSRRSPWHRPDWRPALTRVLLDHRMDLVHVPDPAPWNLDLIRVAGLLGYPVLVDLTSSVLEALQGSHGPLLVDGLGYASAFRLSGKAGYLPDECAGFKDRLWDPDLGDAECYARLFALRTGLPAGDYAAYEFGLRDQGLLEHIQMPHVGHFKGCSRVLDVACGPGIFLQLLGEAGVAAEGVERNAAAVRYARGLGLQVHEADALSFLASGADDYDGLYCSHFIEHLPAEDAERLIRFAARRLRPGGVMVFAFPNPESIRSQLLGFWRDPEHVRFYHPEWVALVARSAGLEVLSGGQGHAVPAFDPEPPPVPGTQSLPPMRLPTPVLSDGRGRRAWRWLLRRLGICSGRDASARLDALEARVAWLTACLEGQQAGLGALQVGMDRLWSVNRTWAWDDNACLVLRRPDL